jgi:putative oxidoreductase
MNVILWILQLVLAGVFAAHGWLLLSPPASVAAQMNAALPRWFQLFLGVAEIAAAAGLILPAVTRMRPQLVPAAGGGIMLVMISATIWHLARSEWSSAGITALLLAIATVVTYQRWRVRPIPPRAATLDRR